jgi:choline dehydrogenase
LRVNLVQPPPQHASVLVVGGGTAGCVVAGRLAEQGHDVVVLEAGPDHGPLEAGAWPEDLLDGRSLPTSHDWGYADGRLRFDRARVIGGCSAHNGCAQNVGWAGDYDALGDGWDATTLAPLFARASETMRLRRWRSDEIQPFQRTFIDAATRLGVPERHDLDDLHAGVSVGCSPVNITVDGVRFNTAFAYLDPVRDRVTVVGDALVDRIVLDGDRAVAVELLLAGVRERITADLIVLAAGVYGTPEVLMRSGVGPAAHLSEVGIKVRHDLPGVGSNLHDHVAVQLLYGGTAALAHDLAAFAAGHVLCEEQALAKLRSPVAGDAPYDLHVYPWVEPDKALEHGWKVVLPVGLLRPASRGAVRLRSADPHVRAHVDHAYLAHADDIASVAFGLDWARSLDLSPYVGKALLEPDPDLDVSTWMRATHEHYWHPAGTCRLGHADDPDAVVDRRGKVRGLEGLYVADASIFPDVPRATPALPTTVVGERIAAFLAEAL